MPQNDQTGPRGQGPLTGLGLGQCGTGSGFGFGQGYGRGFGRGFGLRRFMPFMRQPTKEEEKQELSSYVKDLEEELKRAKEAKDLADKA